LLLLLLKEKEAYSLLRGSVVVFIISHLLLPYYEVLIDFVCLQTWKSLPDDNEFTKEYPSSVISSIDATIERLAASNVFFIAKRKNSNMDVLYMSAKVPRGIPFLIELTAAVGVPGVKCAVKTPNKEMVPLFFEAMEVLIK
jgi:AP-1 complex subunit beta-1